MRTWEQRVPNGVPVAAHFGDRIIVRPLVPGTISFVAYPLTVQTTYATHGRPAILASSGNDTYEIVDDRDGALDVVLEAVRPALSPWLIALLLLCAVTAVVLAALEGLAYQLRPPQLAFPEPAPSAAVIIGSFLLFMLVPRYLHNDQLGGGVNWGYLGWGYVDTLRALPQAIMQSGPSGLVTVETLGKPILYPLLALPFMWLFGPLNTATLVSALCSAIATLGVYHLGRIIFERWAGLLAAVLFAFSPVVLAYATSFYLEGAYLAFFLWSAIFLIAGMRTGSRAALLGGLVFGIFAVGVRNPIMAGLYFITTALLLFAARVQKLQALKVAFFSALAAFLGAVFWWPFLWVDTAQRLPFVLIARLLFDRYYHLTEPLTARITTMATQTFVHTDPLTVVLFFVGIAAGTLRRDMRILWLTTGVIAARLFVAPTAFYLQHYWFYMVPFLQLVAGSAISLVGIRFRMGIVLTACVVVFGWSALYFPYPGTAALGCWSLDCSLQRWGVDEPVYGLKEAAQWIRARVPRGTAIGTLVAPHVLQVQLEGYPVRFIVLGKDRKQQEASLSEIGVRYLVTNSWSKYVYRTHLMTPRAKEIWQGSARDGSPTIFELPQSKVERVRLDAPPTEIARRLLPEPTKRIIVYPRSASYHGAFADRQVVTVSERVHPLSEMRSLLMLGGGILVLPGSLVVPALGYEQPVRAEGGAGAYALPTLNGMRAITTTRMRPKILSFSKQRATVFSGQIVPEGDERFFTDIFEVSARSKRPFLHPESVTIGAACGRAKVALSLVWIDRAEVRGYGAADKGLSPCIRRGDAMWGYLSTTEPSAGTTIRADATLLWNGDNAAAQADGLPMAIVASHPIQRMREVTAEDDVRSFIETHGAAAVIVPSYQNRFDLEATYKAALSDRATLLIFSQPAPLPQETLAPVGGGCVGCRRIGGLVSVGTGGTITWGWILGALPDRTKSISLDASTLQIRKGRAPQAVLQVIRSNGKGCSQWDLGPMRRGHTLNLVTARFAERGCRLASGTQLAFVLYAPPGGITLSAQPRLRVSR